MRPPRFAPLDQVFRSPREALSNLAKRFGEPWRGDAADAAHSLPMIGLRTIPSLDILWSQHSGFTTGPQREWRIASMITLLSTLARSAVSPGASL